MSSKKIKRRDKLARMAIEGKISVPEAQRRAGGKYAAKAAQADLVKMRQAQAARRAQADQLTGIVKEAFDKVLKSAQPRTGDGPRRETPPAQPQHWTGADVELRNRADFHPDPLQREAARQILVDKGMLPGVPASREVTTTTRGMVWAPGPDGAFGWRPVPDPRPLDLGFSPLPAQQEGELMLTPFEVQQMLDQQARERTYKARAEAQAQPPTPGHAAAEAATQYAGDLVENAEAQRRREQVQHEATPYAGDDDGEMDEAAAADVGKRFNQAYDTPVGYPQPARVSAEDFRRGPIRAGEAVYSPGYDLPARPGAVPSATISAASICRPLLADGQSRPSAGGGRP